MQWVLNPGNGLDLPEETAERLADAINNHFTTSVDHAEAIEWFFADDNELRDVVRLTMEEG
jgi:hypothetical protein